MTVQYETLKKAIDDEGASDVALYGLVKAFAMAVEENGMKFGLCVAPETSIEEVCHVLDDLLEGSEPMIEFIDILAVKPGIGGQTFDRAALKKLQYVRNRFPLLPFLGIDGGVSIADGTAKDALNSGANYLIAGSAIFTTSRDARDGDDIVAENISAFIDMVLGLAQ